MIAQLFTQRISLACLLTVAASVSSQAIAEGNKLTVDPSPKAHYGFAAPHFGYHAPVYAAPRAVVIRTGITGDFTNHFQNRIDRIQFGTTYYRDNSFTPMYRHPDRIRYLTRSRDEKNWRSRPHRERLQAAAVAANRDTIQPEALVAKNH